VRTRLFALLFFLLFIPSLSLAETKETVFVSILPQKYFVEKISGGFLDVEVMVIPGASPATYEPKPSQMRKLASSKAYFSIGVPFEKVWLERIAGVNSEMTIIHTDAGIKKQPIAAHHHHEDEHHNGHDDHMAASHNEHVILDPHIWLSTSLVKKQLVTTAEGLKQLFPEYGEKIDANLQDFLGKIDQLDQKIKNILKNKAGMKFMVFHPSWGYFARDYGLEQVAIEIEGKDPKPAQLQKLIKKARERNINIVFVQPQFSTKSAKLIAKEIGGEVVFIDPLAENWLENMSHVAEKMIAAIR